MFLTSTNRRCERFRSGEAYWVLSQLALCRPDYIKTVELPRAIARHKNGEIEVVPVILYPMDLKRDCKFLYEFNPLPEWNKTWQDFIKDGDWNIALPLIGNGIEQAIEKARLRPSGRLS